MLKPVILRSLEHERTEDSVREQSKPPPENPGRFSYCNRLLIGFIGGMETIDIALTREQFDAFDPEVVANLCEATQLDLQEWSGRLRLAWEAADQAGVVRARHALKGVCGNYGADALMALTEEPMLDPGARERLRVSVEETIAAIWAVAQACGTDRSGRGNIIAIATGSISAAGGEHGRDCARHQ